MTAPALPRRNLPLYLGARVAAATGIQIQSVAIGLQVYERTGSTLDLGNVGLAQFVPLALLSAYAGSFADRHDRRTILTACRVLYAVGSLALASLCFAPGWGVGPIYVVLVVLGATRAFSWPASSALLPNVVSLAELPRAIALSSIAFQVATVSGPALSGILYAAAGPEGAYLASAVLEGTSAVLVFLLRPAPRRGPVRPTEPWPRQFLSGLRYVFREKIVLGALSLDLFAVLLGGAVALMPVYATDILGVGATGFGWLRAAPAVGAVVVAIFLASRPIRRRAGLYLFLGVGLFGLATIVFGLSRSFGLSLIALVILGGADMVSVVIRRSLIQLWTPDAMRGRVSAVDMVFVGASNELGEMESGYSARLLEVGVGLEKEKAVVAAVVLGGVGTLMVTGLWAWAFPSLRRTDRLQGRDGARPTPVPPDGAPGGR
ncbi:MAG: MFS transporter [Sandaracinaceae bacterium]